MYNVFFLGYLLDDIGEKGGCVLKTECPCNLHGKIYKSGEVRRGPCGSQWYVHALCPHFVNSEIILIS